MMQDPYCIDLETKYKQDMYLNEAAHERLLRQISMLQKGKNSEQASLPRIRIIIKITASGISLNLHRLIGSPGINVGMSDSLAL
ncbi:MAG: hypothetical protein FJ004_11615 [Chloroflexi bacterium]|nr:hypothetical protein [Chloroflexota bacterium]